MKKAVIFLLLMVIGVTGCGKKNDAGADIIGGSDGPTAIYVAPEIEELPVNESPQESVKDEENKKEDSLKKITDEQALLAIKNYCYKNNPDLEEMEKSEDYTIYWDVDSSDEKQTVVLFRSYTGAIIRYYIDPVSGDTYVTEFVSGITDSEEKTDESFNVRDYLEEGSVSKESSLTIEGTWQTASVSYEADGSMQPEYYVQFTDTQINYGHMKDNEFVVDHSDKISLLDKTKEGGYKVRAISDNGVEYTYQTSESDSNVLEYFETWNEDEFADMYRGGASLSKQ